MGREQDGTPSFGQGRVEALHALNAGELGQGFFYRPLAIEEEVHPSPRVLPHHLTGGAIDLRVRRLQAQHLGGIAQDCLQVPGLDIHEGVGDLVGDVVAPFAPGEGPGREVEEREEGAEDCAVDYIEEPGWRLHPVLHQRHTF
jgi:hypothetical protein